MRWYLWILILLTMSFESFSKPNIIKGKVVDKQSGQPLMYANIAIIESHKGTTSTLSGDFKILVGERDYNNNIYFSSIGYRDTIIPVANLLSNNVITIELQPVDYEIQEVIISYNRKNRLFTINPLKSREIKGGISSNPPITIARLFPSSNEYDEYPFLNSASIYFSRWGSSKSYKVKLRVFSVDEETQLPGKDLLLENVIFESKGGKIITIKLDKYNILMPKEGLFVGIEWLHIPENLSPIEGVDNLRYNSGLTLGAHMREHTNTYHGWAGTWMKYDSPLRSKLPNGKVFDAAISIDLCSN